MIKPDSQNGHCDMNWKRQKIGMGFVSGSQVFSKA